MLDIMRDLQPGMQMVYFREGIHLFVHVSELSPSTRNEFAYVTIDERSKLYASRIIPAFAQHDGERFLVPVKYLAVYQSL